jgi:hypothetical protein
LFRAAEVLSLSTSGEPGGILVRFALAKSKRHLTLFFTVDAALEIRSYVAGAGTTADWVDAPGSKRPASVTKLVAAP